MSYNPEQAVRTALGDYRRYPPAVEGMTRRLSVTDSIPGVASAATRMAAFSSLLNTKPQRSAWRSLTMTLNGLLAHG